MGCHHVPVNAALIPYLGVVALVTATPGPDTLLVTRNAARHGLAAGAITAGGSASGLLVWGAAAAVGLAAVLRASAVAFDAVRILGTAYLVLLGLRLLWSSRSQSGAAITRAGSTRRPFFVQGLLTNLLNPKAAAFFTALLPQFIDHGSPVFATTLLYVVIAAIASASGLSLYAAAASRARAVLEVPRVRKVLERVSGVALIALGVRVAPSGREARATHGRVDRIVRCLIAAHAVELVAAAAYPAPTFSPSRQSTV
jgi:threonine/homoserine/homoserine lactone efflux protein